MRLFRVLSLLIVMAMAACSGAPGASVAPGKVLVAVGIPPLADFVKQVGGDRVEVELLVPPGAA